jgi:N-acetylmuramoyl-L-alanine amidase
MRILERLSANVDDRTGTPISILMMHYTGMTSALGAVEALTNSRNPRVSCHWLVDEDGTVWRLVPEELRAWHAGQGFWRGLTNVNAASIGIEIVNPGHEFGYRPFPKAQMAQVIALSQAILKRHPGIAARDVIAHSDHAPRRRADPGELFDWAWLAREGIGVLPPTGVTPVAMAELGVGAMGPEVDSLRADLARYGYGVEPSGAYDENLTAVVAAFQRHWRQSQVTGLCDGETRAVLTQLLAKVEALS